MTTGKGTIQGNRIDLDEPVPYANGTRVSVSILPEGKPAKGSPSAVLQLVGTLTAQEAEEILKAANESRRIDPGLWDSRP